MEVTLKSGKSDWKAIGIRAMSDAIIWTWFHQVAYESLFTRQITSAYSMQIASLFGICAGVVILASRWDRVPKPYRVAFPTLACATTLFLLLVSQFGLQGTVFDLLSIVLFGVSCFGCQILRLENLTKCKDAKTLSLAFIGSFLMFYALCLALTLVPLAAYNALLVVAPLALVLSKPLKPTESILPLSRKTILKVPNVLVIFFGIAGGFVFASGGVYTATDPSNLLSSTSPTYLIMLLLFVALSVISVSGFHFRKAMYFSLTNMAWSVGLVLGTFSLNIAPVIPDTLSVAISATVIVSFFVFQSTWLDTPKQTKGAVEEAAAKLAQERGLTKRETEVALLLREGRSLRFIQSALFISEGTARTHVKRIYAKLGVHSKQELIDFFQNN